MGSYDFSGSAGSGGRRCRNCGCPAENYDIPALKPSSLSYGSGACGYSGASSYSSKNPAYSAKSSGGRYK